MDQSCSTNYTYIICCLVIAINLVYFIIITLKLFIQYQRRPATGYYQKMTDQSSKTTTTAPSRITTSTSKTGLERLAQLYPHVTEDTPLPSKWNSKEKAPSLALQQNNLAVAYKGPGKSHKDAASVRSDHPIPSLTGIYYYEVKILSKGRDGFMGVGLSTSEVNLNRLPGWDKGSYGYHGDDGHLFCSAGSGIAYGPTFTTGDFVGCCVNFLENSCFYTLNGYNIGTSFKDIPAEVYPTVGLQTPLEAIEANFGLSPFKFDIDKYMDEYRDKTRRAIVECTLKEGELLHQIQLRRIVSTYLVHYGYCATAEQFNKNAENVHADELNSMRNRQLIQNLILEGHTMDAIEKTKELFPTLLNNKNLLFVLKVRQFIEMINGTDSEISKPSTSSQTKISSLLNHKNQLNSLLTNRNASSTMTTTTANDCPSIPLSKSNTSLRSRSNSPYKSESNQTTNSDVQQHSNATNNELSQEAYTTVNSLPSHHMDVDDELNGNSITNGFSNHETVSSSSSSSCSINQISNGHSLLDDDSNNLTTDKTSISNGYLTKSTENLDTMECDGISESNHTMHVEDTSSDVQKKDDEILIKILQFGRELHTLKQQLNIEYGENLQHDKILQDAFSLLAYPDPRISPLAQLLEPSQRESISSVLNSAILEAHDMPRHPALEVLVGYLNECDKLMHKNNIPDCAFIELNKYVR
ncbi:unnamed protein product [Rotaria socialis]|uniref:Uncharacterized protein n=2 Tax=Rotaria socialis TaxID=392032 RepID=A0A817TE38_9BILA|nr:unnamed protein product [Rotaria socialis]CAF3317099.1 unnamed protein product [Rotaria socialis]CAF3448676.1 unnamed protein product [Rotaria socialis]CAF3568832.1 unnamed protein product [Rotaria socialis]CAF4193316.1 unnamed protein product [Rotaria socialis]